MMAESIQKRPTHVPGLDWICSGGLPESSTTLLSGGPGSGKTVLTLHFLAAGILQADESGVFVTFEESPSRLRSYAAGFGWDVDRWEADAKFRFVDVSPDMQQPPTTYVGTYDFGGLITRIKHAVDEVGCKRLVLDSLSALHKNFSDPLIVRHELFRLITALRELGVTAIITDEHLSADGETIEKESFRVEDFVADNLVMLRNRLNAEKRRRTIEVLKFRGTSHRKGEYPFTISAEDGVVIIPLAEMTLSQASSSQRVTSGVPTLDELCGGGFFDGSVSLVTGATGCGKTLMTTQFAEGGCRDGKRCLVLGFEESEDQLFRNASSWGIDFRELSESKLMRVECVYPESNGLEDHLIQIKKHIQDFQPDRIVIDSLSALERTSTRRAFREFVVALTSFLKKCEITALMTLTTPTLMGGSSVTEGHISSIADSIILLRYVEVAGEVRRAITVLKMRGSWHDKEIREFTIDDQGMHIADSFQNIVGILSGFPSQANRDDILDQQ